MLRIDYESEGFAPASGVASGANSLNVTWDDLLWAAMTVGRPNRQYVFRHGSASWYEALFRLSLVRMSLEQAGPAGRRLRRTQAARTLDPSEKGAVNYFLGLAVAKLFADKCLNAPWLLHLDVFRPQLNVELAGRSRPDLVGETTVGGWIALECKGRISRPSENAKQKAKEQAERIVAIDGVVPIVNAGCVTFFKRDVLQFFWRDPTPDPSRIKHPIDLEVPEESWRNYYGPILALFSGTDVARPERRGEIVTARDERLDVTVSIAADVLRLLEAEQWSEARIAAAEAAAKHEDPSLRADGVRVTAGETWLKPFDDEGADRQ
jgi:hypothetical protein